MTVGRRRSASAGAAFVRARDACALVVVHTDGGKTGRVRVLRSWPTVAPGGACSAAVSPPYAVDGSDAVGSVGVVAAAADDASSYVVERVSLADGVVADGGTFRTNTYGPDEHGAPVRAWITGAEANARALLCPNGGCVVGVFGGVVRRVAPRGGARRRERGVLRASTPAQERRRRRRGRSSRASVVRGEIPHADSRAKARFKTATPEEIKRAPRFAATRTRE